MSARAYLSWRYVIEYVIAVVSIGGFGLLITEVLKW